MTLFKKSPTPQTHIHMIGLATNRAKGSPRPRDLSPGFVTSFPELEDICYFSRLKGFRLDCGDVGISEDFAGEGIGDYR